jgi:hypothetical protein
MGVAVNGEHAHARAERFLDSFRLIESHVRRLASVGPETPFKLALPAASARSPEVRRFEGELRQFANLRNAIVHDPYDGREPIADPRENAVQLIGAIAVAILEPPTALSVLKHSVTFATPRMPLSAAATLMMDGHFSQLPIVDKGAVVDVLTSEALARFLTDVVFGAASANPSAEVAQVAGYDPEREVISKPGKLRSWPWLTSSRSAKKAVVS